MIIIDKFKKINDGRSCVCFCSIQKEIIIVIIKFSYSLNFLFTFHKFILIIYEFSSILINDRKDEENGGF